MTIVLAKLTAITVIKNRSQGIHEEEWHLIVHFERFAYESYIWFYRVLQTLPSQAVVTAARAEKKKWQ